METPQQALVREIKEELDTEICVGELIEKTESLSPINYEMGICYESCNA